MEPDLATLVEGVRRAVTGIAGVRVVSLFGSRATGRARADSDLDRASSALAFRAIREGRRVMVIRQAAVRAGRRMGAEITGRP